MAIVGIRQAADNDDDGDDDVQIWFGLNEAEDETERKAVNSHT